MSGNAWLASSLAIDGAWRTRARRGWKPRSGLNGSYNQRRFHPGQPNASASFGVDHLWVHGFFDLRLSEGSGEPFGAPILIGPETVFATLSDNVSEQRNFWRLGADGSRSMGVVRPWETLGFKAGPDLTLADSLASVRVLFRIRIAISALSEKG
jgi:hypothetical protein